jgi:hypothetical protein
VGDWGFVEYEQALGDPIASKTSWSPLGRWGYHFRPRALVQIGPTRWEIRARSSLHFQMSVFTIVGVGAIVVPMVVQVPRPTVTIAVGLVLLIYGIWTYLTETSTVVVDLASGTIARAVIRANALSGVQSGKVLKQVYALQLLARVIDSGWFAELNAVLQSGERVHLFCHEDTADVHASAQKLAGLLCIPVWQGPRKH